VAMTLAQGAAVGGIALVGLGLGFGGAQLGGGDQPPPKRASVARAELPAVTPAPAARVAVLGDAAGLPAFKANPRRPAKPTPTPDRGQKHTDPVPSATARPPSVVPTLAPPKPQPPKPTRTPDQGVIGGG
jgi:hypothetical protein